MQKTVVFSFLILLPVALAAQLRFTAGGGYGQYNMSELAAFQRELKNSFPPVDPKITSSFPGYFYYETAVSQRFATNFLVGGGMAFGSTGGRIHYSDYSGSMWRDQLLRSYSIHGSFGAAFRMLDNRSLTLAMEVRPGLVYTTLELTYNREVGGQKSYESTGYYSLGVLLQPTLTVTKELFRFVGVYAQFGYNVNAARGQFFADDFLNDTDLTTDSGDPVRADWSGLRTALGITFTIHNTRDEDK